jgi:hypothetical protein
MQELGAIVAACLGLTSSELPVSVPPVNVALTAAALLIGARAPLALELVRKRTIPGEAST